MAAAKQPKSILKKSTTVSAKEDRDRETALYHATLIQQRKDVELEILLSTERMIDFPLFPNTTAVNTALSDVVLFKTLLQPFQPSDYDCLIQERNINDHCGYTLCPNPRMKDNMKGKYRIVGKTGRAKDFKVVPREELEMWCSEDCARRAMYVKVQLSERPAWERSASTQLVELLDERKTVAQRMEEQLAEDLRKLELSNAEASYQNAASLALERGDRGVAAANGRVGVSIKENEIVRAAIPPSLEAGDLNGRMAGLHLAVEGYTSSFEDQKMDMES